MKRPEILSPAGNFEKLRAAIRYGADAVYLAGKLFGMRAAADNFSEEELAAAVEYAHERGVKVYLTLNTMPRENEYFTLENYINSMVTGYFAGKAPVYDVEKVLNKLKNIK